ncbi:MAG: IclR family transcriptional regulator [Planctomycetia bacterium]|nr:IclR family transcriptional regulator [Planctomycetia bacterium]
MKTIQSIDRAMMILDEIAKANGEKTLSDLSRDLGMVITTLHGFITSLEKWDLIRKESGTNRYYLGGKLIQLASCCNWEQQIKSAARPYLEELSKKYDETIHLAIPYKDQILYIDKVESSHPYRMTSMVGHKENYQESAIGLLIESHLPEKPRDEKEKRLITECCRGRKALRFHEDLQIYCIAAAFFNPRQEIIGAISFAVPSHRAPLQRRNEMISDLNKTAKKLEADLAGISGH